jgi:hypothetical protein
MRACRVDGGFIETESVMTARMSRTLSKALSKTGAAATRYRVVACVLSLPGSAAISFAIVASTAMQKGQISAIVDVSASRHHLRCNRDADQSADWSTPLLTMAGL